MKELLVSDLCALSLDLKAWTLMITRLPGPAARQRRGRGAPLRLYCVTILPAMLNTIIPNAASEADLPVFPITSASRIMKSAPS